MTRPINYKVSGKAGSVLTLATTFGLLLYIIGLKDADNHSPYPNVKSAMKCGLYGLIAGGLLGIAANEWYP
jgi:hypothetical protein